MNPLQNIPSPQGGNAESRRHKRVNVNLDVTVIIDRGTAIKARTSNVSESGMLLRSYTGPSLPAGRLVGLRIGGVISDDHPGDIQQDYMMRVARHGGDRLALHFCQR
jgi:hypothetical protein